MKYLLNCKNCGWYKVVDGWPDEERVHVILNERGE